MVRRYFWLTPEFVKFRVVFETSALVVGLSDAGERRLFRKENPRISFNEEEALRRSIYRLDETAPDELLIARPAVAFV